MAVSMRHQLVGFLAGGIEAKRMINVMMDGKWHRSIGAIDAGTTGIDQMLDAMMAAAFQYMRETDDVAIDVSHRILQGITHACLRCQIDHALWFVCLERIRNRFSIRQIDTQMRVIRVVGK